MAGSIKDTITLANGIELPQLGLGVWQVEGQNDVNVAVKAAVDNGYGLIDTAAAYFNEDLIGKAVAQYTKREDIFITTKVWSDRHADVEASFQESLDKLGTDYVDLYLLHYPNPKQGLYVQAWESLVKLNQSGRAKAIGVANFKPAHLEKIIAATGVTPAINQVERHPLFQQKELEAFCAEKGIKMQAFSPLTSGHLADIAPAIQPLADKHAKSVAQIILKWHLQTGWAIIPKSVTPSRIAENADLYDFELDEQDLADIAKLDSGNRYYPDSDTVDF